MITKIQIIFYSMYGHIFKMAESVAKGVKEVKETEVSLFRVQELVPEDILEKSGALPAQKLMAHVPIIENPQQMTEADAIIFGTPTRYGNMCAQMRNFLDKTGGLWVKNALVGKLASVFASTGTQHGGQETTITSFHTTLFHLGFIVVGLPYSEEKMLVMDEISGGSPYGATTLAGAKGERQPSKNELAMAQTQGKYVATIAKDLKIGRSVTAKI